MLKNKFIVIIFTSLFLSAEIFAAPTLIPSEEAGVEIWFEATPGSPVVYVKSKTAFSDKSREKFGKVIPSLGTRLLTHGAGGLSAEEFSELNLVNNISIEASSGFPFVEMNASFVKNDLSLAAKVLQAVISDSNLVKPNFEQELTKYVQERLVPGLVRSTQMSLNSPSEIAQIIMRQKLLEGTPSAEISDLSKELQEFSFEKAQAWYNEVVKKTPSHISISGDLKRHEVVAFVKSWTKNLATPPPHQLRTDNKMTLEKKLYVVDMPAGESTIFMSLDVIESSNSLGRAKQAVLDQMISGGFTSVLYRHIRTNLGFVYGIGVAKNQTPWSDYRYISTGTSPANTKDVIEETIKILGPYTTGEKSFGSNSFGFGKDLIYTYLFSSSSSPESLTNSNSEAWAAGKSIDHAESRLRTFKNLKLEDIAPLVPRLTDFSKSTIFVTGPADKMNIKKGDVIGGRDVEFIDRKSIADQIFPGMVQ